MLHFRSIRLRIAVPFVILIVVSLVGLALYLSYYFRVTHLETLEDRLLADLHITEELLQKDLAANATDLDALARRYSNLLGARVTFIAIDGTVLGESDHDRETMGNHLFRTEVQEALARSAGSSIRYSVTARIEVMYVALALDEASAPVAIARIAVPLQQVQAQLQRLNRAILVAVAISSMLAVAVALVIAGRTTAPVRQLKLMAQRVASGDLSARTFPVTRDEVGDLTRVLNDMTEKLEEQLQALAAEQGRLGAILDHMADGVLIVDADGVVKMLNPAAARLLEVEPERALGKTFSALALNYTLIEMWLRCQRTQQEQRDAVEMGHGKGAFLQAIIAPQRAPAAPGYLIVLQDLTQIRRLETIRRDFISNISHELRTPLASLSALVETLQDGALQDPEAAQRFLSHMERELAAMVQIVEELLELSRIESQRAPLSLQLISVESLIIKPVERMMPQAERAGLALTVNLPGDLPPVMADAEGIQRAMINLLHNAIKFTPTGGSVAVSVRNEGEQVVVMVRDTGIGISEQNIPRIFERFYKADRARSGGGTGLGLAIAKHIVQAHRGQIWVESTEGLGSTFYFSLPTA